MKPLCFILMPFGMKKDAENREINFDRVYQDIIKPAVMDAGLEPIRADEEKTDGIIHKPMFERLILCEYAVADLTTANANVFYELGVRHCTKPFTTAMIAAAGSRLPFDVNNLRTMPYQLDATGIPSDAEADRKALADKLKTAIQEKSTDSPVFQLLDNFPNIQHDKTDVFREQVRYAAEIKDKLLSIRMMPSTDEKLKATDDLASTLVPYDHQEAGVLIDLFLTYRHISTKDSFARMVDLAQKQLPRPLAQTVMVREQLAFALNRLGKSDEAIKVLEDLIRDRGGSSETYGILGRIYKDKWLKSKEAAKNLEAKGYLKKAIETYYKGFECDWRDPYPGVNYITLKTISGENDPQLEMVSQVVKFSALQQHLKKKDYWSAATLLEIAFIQNDQNATEDYLSEALTMIRDKWEPETTLNNLRMLNEGQTDHDWKAEILQSLENS